MASTLYEIESIERKTGALESDLMHIGNRFVPAYIQQNHSAVLVYENDNSKSLVTSRVEDIEYLEGDTIIIFTTKHSTYKLRKVAV